MGKKLKGWKTVIFNVLIGGLAILEGSGHDFGLSPEVISAILVLGNLVLRWLTTGPIGTKV